MTKDRLSDFVLHATNVPQSAREMAALLLLDTIGVAAGAAPMEPGKIARDHAVAYHSAGSDASAARLMFDGRTASIPGAAFAAATQIDNLDAHDGYNPTKGHIGCAVVPALFAFAEHRPDLSAIDALDALVMAYEVSARAAIALHATVEDYHTSGAWNALGVAALGCRMRAATSDQLHHALGIAEYHGPRSQMMREIANPTMLHDGSGMGALVGAMAVLLARDGFTGAPAVTVFGEDAAPYWTDLGDVWTIERNYIKPYPICRWAHAALDGLHRLMQDHRIGATDVAAIEVNCFAEAAALYPGMPNTTSQAQYSLPFALATLLVNGQIGPAEITGNGLANPQVAAMLPKIEIKEAERHSARFPEGRWSDVIIRLTDGVKLTSGDVHARGGPEAPMDETEVAAKFDIMARPLPEARRRALWAMRTRLLEPDLPFSALSDLVYAPVGST